LAVTTTTANDNNTNTTIIVTLKKGIKMARAPIIEKQVKIMQIKQETWERLRNHSMYYCGENNTNSYDEIIIKLLDFYEEQYNYDYNDNNDNTKIEQ